MTPAVESFDVFDTCLTRAVGRPADVSFLLGRLAQRRGLVEVGPVRFAHIRAEAELNAARNAGDTEFRLEDVYREMGRAMELAPDVVEQLTGAECEVEARVLRPIPEAVQLVEEARRAGAAIAFLSDMYLPSAFVAQQLMRHGLRRDSDVIMISCETGAPKWTGAAFRRLAADRDIPLASILHTGDHERADVVVPHRLGVQVRPFTAAMLNRYERLLEQQAATTDGLAASLAGASRLTRLELPVEDPDHVAIRDVAAGVVAPALVAFTLWVLRRARQLGVRRLYYVARDGQILVDVVRRLIARMGLDIECVYLYGSRLSWWLPSLASVDEPEVEWAFATHEHIDAHTVTTRLNLSPAVTADLLERAGLGDHDPRALLTPEELARLRAAVVHPSFSGHLVQAAADAREHFVGYLRQIGMFDGVPGALVDIGWIGRMHVSLAKVLRGAGAEPPIGLFFGISGGAPNGTDGDREAYYFDARDPSGYASDVDAVVNMFDVFCTGFGGQTLGYERGADETFVPVFAADHDAVKTRWGLDVLQRAVAHFADVVVLDPDLVDVDADVRAGVDAVVRAFLDRPMAAEARAWGAFPREDEAGAHEQTLAAPYRWSYLLARSRGDTSARAFRYWKQGSVEISPWPMRLIVKGSARAVPTLGRVQRAAHRLLRR